MVRHLFCNMVSSSSSSLSEVFISFKMLSLLSYLSLCSFMDELLIACRSFEFNIVLKFLISGCSLSICYCDVLNYSISRWLLIILLSVSFTDKLMMLFTSFSVAEFCSRGIWPVSTNKANDLDIWLSQISVSVAPFVKQQKLNFILLRITLYFENTLSIVWWAILFLIWSSVSLLQISPTAPAFLSFFFKCFCTKYFCRFVDEFLWPFNESIW